MSELSDHQELWHGLRGVEGRLNLIEQDLSAMKNDRIHMDRRFDRVENQINSLTDAIAKVGWFLGALVTTSIIGGFLTWVIGGGFTNVIR